MNMTLHLFSCHWPHALQQVLQLLLLIAVYIAVRVREVLYTVPRGNFCIVLFLNCWPILAGLLYKCTQTVQEFSCSARQILICTDLRG